MKSTNFASELPTHPFGGILLSVRWDMSRSIRAQHLMFLATSVQNLWKGVQNLQIWPLNITTPHLGEFCYPEMGYVNMSTSVYLNEVDGMRQEDYSKDCVMHNGKSDLWFWERKIRVDEWWWWEMTNKCGQEVEHRSGYGDMQVEQ